MPGAPNRPPEAEPTVPAAPVPTDEAGRRVLRRLAPARVALRLDVWKGAPHSDLLGPFERAEALYGQADFAGAESALDQLSVRFAEPRWPTMPSPFRELRVTIAAPQPPQWDPEFALSSEERDQRRRQREADKQLALAKGSVAWGSAHGIPCDDLAPTVTASGETLAQAGPSPEFWAGIDRVWEAIRQRVPPPTAIPARPAAPTAAQPAERAEAT